MPRSGRYVSRDGSATSTCVWCVLPSDTSVGSLSSNCLYPRDHTATGFDCIGGLSFGRLSELSELFELFRLPRLLQLVVEMPFHKRCTELPSRDTLRFFVILCLRLWKSRGTTGRHAATMPEVTSGMVQKPVKKTP